jgi:hypothetical protein
MRLAGILLALVLSQGWHWSRLLQEHYQLGATAAFLAAVSFTVLFLLQQWMLTIKEPAERRVVRERAAFVDVFLEQLLKEYYAILVTKLGADVAKPIVRANVMLPVVDRLRMRKRLQICYKACPDGVQYKYDEIDLYWSRKNGVVGWVWSRGQAQDYSATRGDANDVAQSLSESQKKAASHLKSVFSVPILQNGQSLGVLTLDGQEDLDRTLFNCTEVRNHLNSYAARLSSLCFIQGVKRK